MATFYVNKETGEYLVASKGADVTAEGFEKLEPNTVDAATEKHVPVVAKERDGHIIHVTVGEVEHPMEDKHFIGFIALEAGGRIEVHELKPGQTPATFFAGGVEHGTVYEYCNLHGLWKAEF